MLRMPGKLEIELWGKCSAGKEQSTGELYEPMQILIYILTGTKHPVDTKQSKRTLRDLVSVELAVGIARNSSGLLLASKMSVPRI